VLRDWTPPVEEEEPDEEKRLFWLRGVVREMLPILQAYQVKTVRGDFYGGNWPAERFREGVHVQACGKSRNVEARCIRAEGCWMVGYERSELKKNDLYRDLLPVLNSGRVQLLDIKRLRGQFTGLDRRTARGGQDSIDHAKGAHDELANVTAGVLLMVNEQQRKPEVVRNENQEQFELRRIHEKIKERMKKAERQQRRGGGGHSLPSY
jgi:hypothetical protein